MVQGRNRLADIQLRRAVETAEGGEALVGRERPHRKGLLQGERRPGSADDRERQGPGRRNLPLQGGLQEVPDEEHQSQPDRHP
ncbi:UNVERIFIED_CONTAM: hypothetical protein PYX00_007035 [Menopon gallinae]|uniref:Uncharacterized protein n=1 Tax=Menopon gallinae TaxID=328185 RepID=A0AAW2HI61_9NEOP